MQEVEVEVWRLVQDARGKDVVLLRDQQQRHLPIWIGPCEATAIWLKLAGPRAGGVVRRPMTHDLCVSIIERLGGRIERIVIDDMSNDTYYAKIQFAVDGCAVMVDSRPSDAIALALRCSASVWVADEIMEAGNVAIEEDELPAPPESSLDEPETWTEDQGG
jgi:hypothetical protein